MTPGCTGCGVRKCWPCTFMDMAVDLAIDRGDCTRRKVACMIFNPRNGDLIEPGYNGAPPGKPGCLTDGACPRGQHWQNPAKNVPNHNDFDSKFCQCGSRWPCKLAVEPGSSYDTGLGACVAVHAEANGLMRAGRRARGMTMVLAGVNSLNKVVPTDPCDGCMRLCSGARLARIVTSTRVIELALP